MLEDLYFPGGSGTIVCVAGGFLSALWEEFYLPCGRISTCLVGGFLSALREDFYLPRGRICLCLVGEFLPASREDFYLPGGRIISASPKVSISLGERLLCISLTGRFCIRSRKRISMALTKDLYFSPLRKIKSSLLEGFLSLCGRIERIGCKTPCKYEHLACMFYSPAILSAGTSLCTDNV